jgi:hypothetical protein
MKTMTFTGGTQPGDTARDPNQPGQDNPIKQAQEQDDSAKATAGVKSAGGTKLEVTGDDKQGSVQMTIPFDGSSSTKPVDTEPSVWHADAPRDSNSCVAENGQEYPDGWIIYKDNQPTLQCAQGIWMPSVPDASVPEPGDYPLPSSDPRIADASAYATDEDYADYSVASSDSAETAWSSQDFSGGNDDGDGDDSSQNWT